MIQITSKFRNFPDLVTGDGSLKGSGYVLDLGVLIDNNLIFQQHIKNVCIKICIFWNHYNHKFKSVLKT